MFIPSRSNLKRVQIMSKKLWRGIILLLCMASFTWVACDKEEETIDPMTIQITTAEGAPLQGYDVVLIELRTDSKYSGKTDAQGQVVLELPKGHYNALAELKDENGVLRASGHLENITITGGATLEIPVETIEGAPRETFLLDKLYFNCSKAGEWQKAMYEEFLTITNASDAPAYCDGLSIAVCADHNTIETPGPMAAYLPNQIVVSQIYTIPGSGTEHLVKAGESIVIAHSAIDHRPGGMMGAQPQARDLSGADFEIYVPHEYSMTVDNPEVSNMVVDYSQFQAFQWGYIGYAPMLLLRTEGDLKSYIEQNKKEFDLPGGSSMKGFFIPIPTAWVLDGVESSANPLFFRKVLPDAVDRGRIAVKGENEMMDGFNGELVQRKRDASGKLIDTNNSSNDFEVAPIGNLHYPKK